LKVAGPRWEILFFCKGDRQGPTGIRCRNVGERSSVGKRRVCREFLSISYHKLQRCVYYSPVGNSLENRIRNPYEVSTLLIQVHAHCSSVHCPYYVYPPLSYVSSSCLRCPTASDVGKAGRGAGGRRPLGSVGKGSEMGFPLHPPPLQDRGVPTRRWFGTESSRRRVFGCVLVHPDSFGRTR